MSDIEDQDDAKASLIDFETAVSLAEVSGARMIAIDGLPVAGKSTLADRMAAAVAAECLFLDDFVKPRAEWRTPPAPGFPFDYIRYEAFLAAVRAVSRGAGCRYAAYDWATGALSATPRVIQPGRRVIVEGVSALHPDLAPLYDLRFWVESDAATTLSAALQRGVGDWQVYWRDLFMPSVALYLKGRPWQRADHRVAGRGTTIAPGSS